MTGKDLLTTRRSIRRFTDEVVPKETIEEIINISRYAPSWKNYQVARFNIVENKEIINKIGDVGVNDFVYNTKTLQNANQICVLSYKKDISGKHEGELATSKTDWEVFDAGIASLQFCLAAHELGVSTLIMGIFDDKTVSDLINLPEDEAIGAIIVFGYNKHDNPEAPKRLEVKDLTRFK